MFKLVPTVDSVVAQFDKVLTKLEKVITYHHNAAEDKEDKAEVLLEEAKEHLKEKARAEKVAQKISTLIN